MKVQKKMMEIELIFKMIMNLKLKIILKFGFAIYLEI